jgi:hypothetical protein
MERKYQKTALRNTRFDVFIATPMSAFDSDEDYKNHRELIMYILKILRKDGLSVYFAGEGIASFGAFSGENAFALDIQALENSANFYLIMPCKVYSSVLVELGYALGLRKPCTIFVRDKEDLPYVMRDPDFSTLRNFPPTRVFTYNDDRDLITQLTLLH